MYSTLKKVSDTISFVYKTAAMVTVFAILAIMSLQVFFRYILNNSLSWSEELARFLFVWASMLGAVVVTANNGHAAIKMLDGVLPKTAIKVKAIVFNSFILLVGLMLFVFGIKLVNSVWNQTSAAMKLCYAYVYMAIPAGGLGIMIEAATNCLCGILELAGKGAEPAETVKDGEG